MLKRILILMMACTFTLALAHAQETTGVNAGVGSILLLKKQDRYGALSFKEIHLPTGRLAFDWFFLPGMEKDFGSESLQSGYNIAYLEDGKATLSFACFALTAVQGPGGQLLLRATTKPGLNSNNIYFSFAHVAEIGQVNLNTYDYEFALMPGPPRTVAFDAEKAAEAFKPTPLPDDQFLPAQGSVLSATDPVFQWPAKTGAVAY